MKREKEIELAMKEAISETIVAAGWGMTPRATDLLECAFTKGAEWADKTMLDRACKIGYMTITITKIQILTMMVLTQT